MLEDTSQRRLVGWVLVSAFVGLMLGLIIGRTQGDSSLQYRHPPDRLTEVLDERKPIVKVASVTRQKETELPVKPVLGHGNRRETSLIMPGKIAGWQALGKLQSDSPDTRIQIPVFAPSGDRLSNACVELFALNAGERTAIESVLAQTATELARFQTENSVIRKGLDGSLSIDVAGFPMEGGRLYDALYAGISAVLGPDRQEVFLQLASSQLDDHMAGFGANDRNITLSPLSQNETGTGLIYQWKDARTTADAQGTTGGRGNRQDLEQRFGAVLLQHIPAKFWATEGSDPSLISGIDITQNRGTQVTPP